MVMYINANKKELSVTNVLPRRHKKKEMTDEQELSGSSQ